ncbi:MULTISPECIES: AAA family ATPase [unclassified Luteibacter]|uniref:AAA family ATPase n=1 Tax=Luteibacter sp. PvP019 TaxID=3156436 RepID=UPI003394400A
MYTIQSIEIGGFWHQHRVEAHFNSEVNVIIGRNGTGKTTFMNILHGVLAVDLEALEGNQFDNVLVILKDEEGRKRTVKVEKTEDKERGYSYLEYRISSRKFVIVMAWAEEGPRHIFARRKANEQASEVREVLAELLSLASLSVYRLRIDPDTDPRSAGRRIAAPVDSRLAELTQQLTHYQLELSQQAQDVSINLQRQVLTSLLYEKEADSRAISLSFNAQDERSKLTQAYAQLGVTGSGVTKRIIDHVASIEQAVKALSEKRAGSEVDFATFDAKRRTEKVVKLSLEARKKTTEIYKQINLFLTMIGTFITDKKFSLIGGDLRVEATSGTLPLERLSSGEKQLLILLIEALLQRERPFVFLADEPELSLHIAWQKRIVPAVQKMNPNAQIIVATHSPEVAGRYANSTIDMEDVIHGAA